MLEPAQSERPQRGAGARRIIGNRIGPGFDAASERAGDTGLLHRLVETNEFGIAAVETEDVHRLPGRGGFADHRD